MRIFKKFSENFWFRRKMHLCALASLSFHVRYNRSGRIWMQYFQKDWYIVSKCLNCTPHSCTYVMPMHPNHLNKLILLKIHYFTVHVQYCAPLLWGLIMLPEKNVQCTIVVKGVGWVGVSTWLIFFGTRITPSIRTLRTGLDTYT